MSAPPVDMSFIRDSGRCYIDVEPHLITAIFKPAETPGMVGLEVVKGLPEDAVFIGLIGHNVNVVSTIPFDMLFPTGMFDSVRLEMIRGKIRLLFATKTVEKGYTKAITPIIVTHQVY